MIEGQDARLTLATDRIIEPHKTLTFFAHRVEEDIFRPMRLVITSKSAKSDDERWNVLVRSVFVGASSQMVNGNPITSSVFAPESDPCISFETMAPGIMFRLRLENTSDEPVSVSAHLEGVAVEAKEVS